MTYPFLYLFFLQKFDVLAAGGIAIVGVLVLLLRELLFTQKGWLKNLVLKEVARDIGIAFIVAGIVSLGYEWSTRSIAEHEKMERVLNSVMATYIPENVWGEVNTEVIRRNVLRRNAKIRLKLFTSGPLPDGQSVSLPPGQAVLWMEYGYDLYGLTSGSSRATVTHQLDDFMLNKEMNLPRFVRVEVIKYDPGETKQYTGPALDKIYDRKKGSINLIDGDGIDLPPPADNVPVRVVTERYEIVHMPGAYTLVTPELVAKDPGLGEPAIEVSIEDFPADIEPAVVTYLPSHIFSKPDPNKNVWRFDGILLPGQSFSIVFNPRSGK